MKSEDILSSGHSVSKCLFDSTDILDFGCNIGYLASFYSKIFKNSTVVGFDSSSIAIKLAKKLYDTKSYNNLSFSSDYNSIKKSNFDYIVDTQCLSTLNKKQLNDTLIIIYSVLRKLGKLISISNLSNEIEANNYIDVITENNMYLESISPVIVNTIHGIQAYSKLIITKNKNNHIIDIENYYNKLRKKIALLKFFGSS